jgi:hypothetical protein
MFTAKFSEKIGRKASVKFLHIYGQAGFTFSWA